MAEAAATLLVFEAWLAFLGEDKPQRGSGEYSQPQNVPVVDPQLCPELGDAGNTEDFGQQVLVCHCRGSGEHSEQSTAHRDTRQGLEGEQHKLFKSLFVNSSRGGFGDFGDFSAGFPGLAVPGSAGHVHVQGQSHRAGTGQEHNPTLPQLQPIS